MKRPLKILFVTAEYPPERCGGIGYFYFDLVRRLESLGVRTRVVTPPHPGPGAPAETLRRRFDLYRAARLAAEEFQPDVVETHEWAAPLLAAPWRPLAVRLHGSYTARRERPSRFWKLLESRTLNAADEIVSVSAWAARRTAAAFGIHRSIRVLPSGVDTELFRPPIAPRNPEEILYVGSPRADKGVGELLQAAGEILMRRPAATLTVAGATEEELSRWMPLVPRAAHGRIRCLGRTPRHGLAALLGRSAVCVFPGLAEALGLACVEAMATGAAVVGSTRGGAVELIEHGRSGLLVDPLKPGMLTHSIETLLASDAMRRTLGEAARARSVERFSIDRTTRLNLDFYQDLCGRSFHPRRTAA